MTASALTCATMYTQCHLFELLLSLDELSSLSYFALLCDAFTSLLPLLWVVLRVVVLQFMLGTM